MDDYVVSQPEWPALVQLLEGDVRRALGTLPSVAVPDGLSFASAIEER